MNLDELITTDRGTITVPEAAEVLGIGRSAAFDAVHRDEIPVLRLGRRMRVPVPALRSMLHIEPPVAVGTIADANDGRT